MTSHSRLGSVPESASQPRSTFSKSVGEYAASSFNPTLKSAAAGMKLRSTDELKAVAESGNIAARLSRRFGLLRSSSYGLLASRLKGRPFGTPPTSFEGSAAEFQSPANFNGG